MSCCINVDQFSNTKLVAYIFVALSDFNPGHFFKHNLLVYSYICYVFYLKVENYLLVDFKYTNTFSERRFSCC